MPRSTDPRESDRPRALSQENNIFGQISDTRAKLPGRITIQSLGTFEFDPSDIVSQREDVFPAGYFSVFDILVHLDQRGEIEEHFRKQIRTKRGNGNTVVVSEVIIRGPTARRRFEHVEVRPHDLRPDMFQDGVVTAVDVIMSLGEAGLLSYAPEYIEFFWICV